MKLAGGATTVMPFYGRTGARRHLTEIADVIAPAILALTLRQITGLVPAATFDPDGSRLPPPAPDVHDTTPRLDGGVLVSDAATLRVITNGPQVLGVLAEGTESDRFDLPTTVFGERPSFERVETGTTARTCDACGRSVAYYDPVLEADALAGYACPHCRASPIEG